MLHSDAPLIQKLDSGDDRLCFVQPGVASVYCTIVQQTQNGVEFYLKGFPQLAGKTFQEVRRLFDDAVLVGYSRDDEKGQPELHINPEESDVLQEDDRVIALSQTGHLHISPNHSILPCHPSV